MRLAARYRALMITAVIRKAPGARSEWLAASLSALVPAVAHGLVGDAVVLAASGDSDAELIADAAGAVLVLDSGRETDWMEAARLARGRWLLLLAAGDRVEPGWMHEAERELPFVAGCRARMRRYPERFADRLVQIVADRLAPSRLSPGLLVSREALLDRQRRLAGSVRRLPVRIEAVGSF